MLKVTPTPDSEPKRSHPADRVPFLERLAGPIYMAVFCLALTVLWALAEMRSLQDRTPRIEPAAPDVIAALPH